MARTYSPPSGGHSRDWCQQATVKWLASAQESGIDVSDFPAAAPLKERIAWARRQGLLISAVYGRHSSKRQKSLLHQLLAIAASAAKDRTFIPAESFSSE